MRLVALLIATVLAVPVLAVDPPAALTAPAFDPATIPLVEVLGACHDRHAIMGIVIAPGQVLLSPGEMWTPGAIVRCVRTGAEAPVVRIANWGGSDGIEWAVVDVDWPDGAGPAPVVVAAADPPIGAALDCVNWHDGAYTVMRRSPSLTVCGSCKYHLYVTEEDEPYQKHHLGSPLLNEEGELVGLLRGIGFSLGAGFLQGGWYQGIVPRSQWQAEAIEPASEQRFAEVLRDSAQAREALARSLRAFRAGAWTESLDAARDAVAMDPNSGKAWLMIGYSASRLDRHRIAATSLRNALRRGEVQPDATGLLAMTLASLGEDEEAGRLALSIEENWPEDRDALGNAAIALGRLGRFDDCRRVVQRVLELDPDDERAAQMLQDLDRLEQRERR